MKNSILNLRINEYDKLLLNYVALKNGYDVSKYLTLCIENIILPYKVKINKGEYTYADIKTLCDNFIQQRKILGQ